MASPAGVNIEIYNTVAKRMPMEISPSGCCEGHYFRTGETVPAVRNGLCYACLMGTATNPEEEKYIGPGCPPSSRTATKPKSEPRRHYAKRRTAAQVAADMATGKKLCRKCDQTKPLILFRPFSASKDHRLSWCMECEKAYHQLRRRKG